MRDGYIKLWRKIWENPLMRNPAYFSVFCWMLSEATHGVVKEDGKWRKAKNNELPTVIFKGNRITLCPGQFTAGVYQIASATGVPRGTVERIIKRLKSEEQIEVQASNKFSLYTVIKWKEYQMNEEQNEEQVRNKRGTSEEQMRTPEECKNDKNEKNEKNITDAIVSVSANADVLDEFEQFVQWLNARQIFPNAKQGTAAARKKWKTRRETYPARQLAEAFANLRNEPDKWKLNNNGHRPLAWWLHSDERIEEMLSCHLKKAITNRKRGVGIIGRDGSVTHISQSGEVSHSPAVQ